MPLDNVFSLDVAQNQTVSIRLYLDEIKQAQDRNGRVWMYIGVVAIREEHHKDLVTFLAEEDYALHFDDIRKKRPDSPKVQVAEQWLNLIAADTSPIHFKVLGIAMDRLNEAAFGDEKVCSRAYHRFMRSAMLGLINGVFHKKKYSSVEILDVYHDRTHHAAHWETMPLKKIGEQCNRIDIKCEQIEFINSDHRKDDGHIEHSRIIQLVDLILGSCRYVLDAPECKKKQGAEYLAKNIHEFVARLNHEGKRYNYKHRCGVSYFPKTTLSAEQLTCPEEQWKNHFFNTKPLLWNSRGESQGELF